MANILITGGTGLIGQYLIAKLEQNGHQVRILSRNPSKSKRKHVYYWNIDQGKIDAEAFAHLDYIIHLAGANIAQSKWTNERKKEIIDSRIKSVGLLLDQVARQQIKLKGIVSSSAVGYYGAVTQDTVFKEEDPPHTDFLGKVCEAWEDSVQRFKELGIRTVVLRTGVVLAKEGGALKRMMGPMKWGLGSALGTGKQYMPWIHIDDLVSIYEKALLDEAMDGAFNAVAPEHATNNNFMSALAKAMNRPKIFPPVPRFILKMMFGEMAVTFLEGSRVSSDKIRNYGFTYGYPDLEGALKNLLA